MSHFLASILGLPGDKPYILGIPFWQRWFIHVHTNYQEEFWQLLTYNQILWLKTGKEESKTSVTIKKMELAINVLISRCLDQNKMGVELMAKGNPTNHNNLRSP